MKLEFENLAHIALAQQGAILKEIENEKTTLEEEIGCTEGCNHYTKISYRCKNCGWHTEGKDYCKSCEFLTK